MKDYSEFYKKQISLTEWFEAIGHPQTAALRQEDNDKRERLAVLFDVIALPFDRPVQFSAQDVANRTSAFKTYLADHGNELCAVRIIPTDPKLPKLRMRGESVTKGTTWFDDQDIDPALYRVDFVPHFKPTWSTIFIVNDNGIFGDITEGWHYKLTQGTPDGMEAISFSYDFKTWKLSRDVPGVKEHLQDVLKHITVTSAAARKELSAKLGATFANDYLAGYFETTYDPTIGTWFIDYNRMLGEELSLQTTSKKSTNALVTGRCASKGIATGIVKIVQPDKLDAKLPKNTVLVCTMTTPDYLPLMQQASAIITELGGILSHAAIVARELKIPCITGAKYATTLLKNGQKVIVNATASTVTAA